jgi:hypothetical protein
LADTQKMDHYQNIVQVMSANIKDWTFI